MGLVDCYIIHVKMSWRIRTPWAPARSHSASDTSGVGNGESKAPTKCDIGGENSSRSVKERSDKELEEYENGDEIFLNIGATTNERGYDKLFQEEDLSVESLNPVIALTKLQLEESQSETKGRLRTELQRFRRKRFLRRLATLKFRARIPLKKTSSLRLRRPNTIRIAICSDGHTDG
ncbi:hypothetical protein PIB30_050560 [Stylosanthes scabra]|uniref:Uncharacterized protein n=1 Tax=Stylosanthes scabra TaxID=79078 RepID=A0ABU6RI72_9FABA|nr:hypothetical protein [Stylosanthes scabra]